MRSGGRRPLRPQEMINLIQQSPLILVDLCAGGVILGLPLAFAGYVVVLRAVPMGTEGAVHRRF